RGILQDVYDQAVDEIVRVQDAKTRVRLVGEALVVGRFRSRQFALFAVNSSHHAPAVGELLGNLDLCGPGWSGTCKLQWPQALQVGECLLQDPVGFLELVLGATVVAS